MPNNDFAPYPSSRQCFRVRNIADPKKTVRIFNYPIYHGDERDLLAIRGIGEADIRASLLKGELYRKLITKEVVITCSDIDLLQFNEEQKAFLKSSGVVLGTEIGVDEVSIDLLTLIGTGGDGYGGLTEIPFLFRQNIPLVGVKDGVNRIFTVPSPDKFLHGSFLGNTFHINLRHNGRVLISSDYLVQESVSGDGFDTVIFVGFVPVATSQLFADYMIKA